MYEKFEKFGLSSYPPEIRGRFNSFITTQFDDSLSVEMQLRSIIKWAIENFDETVNQTNNFIDFLNDLIGYMNEFIETFDTKFQDEILLNLQKWHDDGTLETLINESLNTKYHEMNNRLTTQLALTEQVKADRNEVYLKANELDINDFNEETRQSILENNQMDINYVLGEGNVKNENLADEVVTWGKISEKMDGNILNKDELVLGGMWFGARGEKPTLRYNQNYAYKKEPIPVVDGEVVRFNHAGGAVYYIGVDSSGNITQIPPTMSPEGETYVTTQSPTVAFYTSVWLETIDEAMMTINEPLPTTYQPYHQRKQLDWLKVVPENISSELKILPRHMDRTQNINLFDYTTVTDGQLVTQYGDLIPNADYCVSDYIKVNRHSTYKITSNRPSTLMIAFDENKNVIRIIHGETDDELYDTFTFNATDFDYIRININKNLVNPEEYVVALVENFDTADGKIPWLRIDSDNLSPNLELSGTNKELDRFKDLNLLVSGDSITEKNYRAERNWHDFLKDWLDLGSVYNDGKSGSGLIKNNGIAYRLDEWETKYGTENNVDMILLMGNMNDGTNDLYGDATNGWNWLYGENDLYKDDWTTVPDTNNMKESMWMATRYVLENLISMYPNTPIGFISSQPRDSNSTTKTGTSRGSYTTSDWGKNGWFDEWVGVLDTICGHYSIPFLDLYHNSGLRPWNDVNNKKYFSVAEDPNGDRVHPNTLGQELMAQKIYEFVKQYM